MTSKRGRVDAAEEGGEKTVETVADTIPIEEGCVGIDTVLVKHLKDVCGYTSLFPVQHKTLAAVLGGNDVVVRSKTGSGKTLAFALPILQRLVAATRSGGGGGSASAKPSALVLSPTRELALQSCGVFEKITPEKYGSKIRSCAVYGGGQNRDTQRSNILRGADVVVGTPGRLIEFINNKILTFDGITSVVLDEGDRMLDEGFAADVEVILKAVNTAAKKRPQVMLFSATLPEWVESVSQQYLKEHKMFDFVGNDKVKVSDTVKFCDVLHHSKDERLALLADIIRVYAGVHGRVIVFTATKAECHELGVSNVLKCDVQTLHGDMTQDNREKTMAAFREGKFAVLIATDVAARGLDIPRIDLVVQTHVPKDAESFIHRAGRTGRAGRAGMCVVIRNKWDDIDKLERRCGIKFQPLRPPSEKEVMVAISRDVAKSLETVSDGVVPWFCETAKTILDGATHDDTVKVLAKALALLSGYTAKGKGRGLIGLRHGQVTLVYTPVQRGKAALRLSAVLDHVYHLCGEQVMRSCRHVTVCAGTYAVFDIDEPISQQILNAFADCSDAAVAVLDELPADYVPRADAPNPSERPPSPVPNYYRGGRGRGGGRGYSRGSRQW